MRSTRLETPICRVWTIFSTRPVLQLKPGLLMSPELVDELLSMMADGIARAELAAREGER